MYQVLVQITHLPSGNKITGNLFQSPMEHMNFVVYRITSIHAEFEKGVSLEVYGSGSQKTTIPSSIIKDSILTTQIVEEKS